MPLDPFFRERLRVHRRYLFDQAVSRIRDRLRGLRRTRDAAPSASPSPAAPPSRRSTPGAPASPSPASAGRPRGRYLSPRERHRRAARRWDAKELATVGRPGPEMETEEHVVPVAGYPDVRVRLYRPASAPHLAPACLVLAGGAFRIGGIDFPTVDAAARRRADRSGVVLVAVDYALAPEARYPAAVEQAYAAWVWLHAEAAGLGIDPDRLGIAGTSAGGNIAAAVTLANRDRDALPVQLQILEVPVTDLTGRRIDLRATWALGIPAFLALRELRSVAQTYLGEWRRAREPLASPLRAASHAGLPPAIILTAEYDPLRGDGAAYGAALRAAGVEASVTRYLGVTHDTPIFVGALEASRRWEDEVVSGLRRL
ncbi:alpha/beta hydrolase [Microbacterium sp. LMI1-1-1.1]|uniref:alpha/beta hydrolase n=1 Tax=Microbacterium sp. LMI1-1-1.1 TaxID=3135223 RepID=UPI00346775D3